MASLYSPIRGLYLRHGFYKSIHKGEDAWIQKPGMDASLVVEGLSEPFQLDIFGVFDGHGGKQAAAYVSRRFVDEVAEVLSEYKQENAIRVDSQVPPELINCKDLSEEDWKAWEGQQEVASILPSALVQAFQKLQSGFFASTKESGTTATVVVVAGWEVIVANVGDSCAFLDTGSEVVQISGNHRLEDNTSEQERLKALGVDLSPSSVEGNPCGPLRVWPGGLAMSRSIGDHQAGDPVLCQPEVRQVTLPSSGGRIIIASDGLWDAILPKTAAHHVRGLPATKAARELVAAALKSKGLRDDITVEVVDLVEGEAQKLPQALSRGSQLQMPPVNWHLPLQATPAEAAACRSLLWQRRLDAVRAVFPKTFASKDEEDLHSAAEEQNGSSQSSATGISCGADSDACEGFSSGEGSQNAGSEGESGLRSNPFALAAEDLHHGNKQVQKAQRTSGPTKARSQLKRKSVLQTDKAALDWETVAPKAKAVPKRGRKDALLGGSPSDPAQLPKALKEGLPSPAASPMQTPGVGSLPEKSVAFDARRGRRGRGGFRRGNGKGRGGSGRGEFLLGSYQAPAHHIDGFTVKDRASSSLSQLPGDCDQASDRFGSGFTFLSNGGFSFGPMAAQPAVIEFTPAPRREGEAEGPRVQLGRSSRRPKARPAGQLEGAEKGAHEELRAIGRARGGGRGIRARSQHEQKGISNENQTSNMDRGRRQTARRGRAPREQTGKRERAVPVI